MIYQTKEKGLNKVSIYFVGGITLIEQCMDKWFDYCICILNSLTAMVIHGPHLFRASFEVHKLAIFCPLTTLDN